MSTQNIIPPGYRENARGDLVPEASIAPIDIVRDQLVMEIVKKAEDMRSLLRALKQNVFEDIESFIELSAEQYGVKTGGLKGNCTLTSFDGRYKIVRANADELTFDERLQAAKALIDECVREWSQGANPGLITLVNDAFRVDKQGGLSATRILGLRRHDINDPRWRRAMDAISDAVQIVGSKSYVRVYERVGKTESYKQIPLDIAGV
jgi:Protein of unknown function (DUF3164).